MWCRTVKRQFVFWLIPSIIIGLAERSVAIVSANEKASFSIRRWTVDDGLPQNRITAIAQTSDGYLWLGTWFGLVRFDGVRPFMFNRYNTPAFVNDAVNALAVARDGALWIGTPDGLLRFRDNEWKRFTKEDGLPDNGIWNLAFEPGGELCISAGGDWVGHFPGGPFNLVHWQAGVQTPIRKLVMLPAGNIAVVVPTGLARLSDPTETIFPWPSGIVMYDYPRAIEHDGHGGWWFGTATSLLHAEDSNGWTRVWTNTTSETVLGMLYRDKRGTLWAQVGGRGLHLFNGSSLEPLPLISGEHQPDVTAFFEDREGNFWVGTDAGLFQLRQRIMQAFTRVDGLVNDEVWSVSEGLDGTVWMASRGGLTRIGSVGAQITPEMKTWYRGYAHRCVTVDNSGTVWSDAADSRGEGLVGLSTNSAEISDLLNHESVEALYLDRDKRLWVGTDKRACCFRNGEKLELAGLPKVEIRFSLQAHDGAMWFGSKRDGLFRWRDGGLEQFTKANGLADDFVIAIHEDGDGMLWIATANGLSRFVPPRRLLSQSGGGRVADGLASGQFFTFTTAHGLLDNLINHILEDDDGFLWFSCNRGIFRIACQELNAVAEGKKSEAICAIFGTADGMVSSETNGEHQPAGCRTRDGRLWFPTTIGVVAIDPKKFAKNEVPPPVVIEQVRADKEIIYGDGTARASRASAGEALTENHGSPRVGTAGAVVPETVETHVLPVRTPELHLAPGRAHVLQIQYTANTFVSSDKARFKYRLDGYDADWRDAGDSRIALYTDLRPGDYTFRVTACNSHGVWNDAPASLTLSVAPHLYETWPFYGVCATTALLSALGLHHRRVKILQRIERLEREQAVQAERARIARDLHDELGANLTGIALKTNLVQRQLSEGNAATGQLEEIATSTRALVDNMRETIWALNPKHDTLESLVRFLAERVEDFVTKAGLSCRFKLPQEVPSLVVPSSARHQISLVVKEALHNAVKHANAREVQFQLEINGTDLRLRIADDGRGFSGSEAQAESANTADPSKGNGLSNMRHRVKSLGGDWNLETDTDRGTVISVRIPLESFPQNT